jgi:hypothetical protein
MKAKFGTTVQYTDDRGEAVPAIVTEVVNESTVNLKVFCNHLSAFAPFVRNVPYGTGPERWQFIPESAA